MNVDYSGESEEGNYSMRSDPPLLYEQVENEQELAKADSLKNGQGTPDESKVGVNNI